MIGQDKIRLGRRDEFDGLQHAGGLQIGIKIITMIFAAGRKELEAVAAGFDLASGGAVIGPDIQLDPNFRLA